MENPTIMPEEITRKEYEDIVVKLTQLSGDLKNLTTLINERFAAHKIALEKSESVLEARLNGMNEFRQQISEERGDFVKKEALDLRLKPLEQSMSYNKGRDNTIGVLVAVTISAVAVVIEVIKTILGH
jgi:hypothetical protein